jgi:hypothetical protein
MAIYPTGHFAFKVLALYVLFPRYQATYLEHTKEMAQHFCLNLKCFNVVMQGARDYYSTKIRKNILNSFSHLPR